MNIYDAACHLNARIDGDGLIAYWVYLCGLVTHPIEQIWSVRLCRNPYRLVRQEMSRLMPEIIHAEGYFLFADYKWLYPYDCELTRFGKYRHFWQLRDAVRRQYPWMNKEDWEIARRAYEKDDSEDEEILYGG
jgi:hypothetical protein